LGAGGNMWRSATSAADEVRPALAVESLDAFAEVLAAAQARIAVAFQLGVIVFFLQIDTLTQKNSSRDNHLQNWLSRTACAFGAD